MRRSRTIEAGPGARGHGRRAGAIVGSLLAVAGLAVALLAAIAWRSSDLILGPDRPPTLREQRVLATGPGTVRLSRDAESLEPGVWALQWEGGFGRVGPVLAADGASVTREFEALAGTPPAGGWASLRGVSRSADPRTMLGLAYENVTFDGPLGRYPAWFVPGRDSTWAVLVHGRGTDRAECLRTLGVLAPRGLPALLVTYRNDAGAPRTRDGRYRLGLTEWEDLEAAVRYALAHGARGVLVCGYSMGGHVAMQFLRRSSLAPQVRGVVLESPVLDWSATFAWRARTLGAPAIATPLGKLAATARAGLDWNQLDLVTNATRPPAPVLLFHCLGDRFSPESESEAYARALPLDVTLVRVPGGNHVEAWNHDPARYTLDLNRWLDARRIGEATP